MRVQDAKVGDWVRVTSYDTSVGVALWMMQRVPARIVSVGRTRLELQFPNYAGTVRVGASACDPSGPPQD